jgi:ankyrin repeat protein
MFGGCASASIILASDPPVEADEETLADYLEILKSLIADGRADPGACYSEALTRAARKGFTDAVRLLLAQASVNPAQSDSRALRMASWYGNVDVVEVLLQDGRSDPNAARDFDFTSNNYGMLSYGRANALGLAARAGHTDIVELLLNDPKTDPTAGGLSSSMREENRYKSPALAWASGAGHEDIVRLLLEDGRADPSASKSITADQGLSAAVLYSIWNDRPSILRLLLGDERVSKDPISIRRYIQEARQYSHGDIIKILQEYL